MNINDREVTAEELLEITIPSWIDGSDPDAEDRWRHAKKLREQGEEMRLSNAEDESR